MMIQNLGKDAREMFIACSDVRLVYHAPGVWTPIDQLLYKVLIPGQHA